MIKVFVFAAALAAIVSAQSNNELLLSPRLEIPMGTKAGAMGGAFEAGVIFENGIYLTGELGGGVYYYGGLANFGYYFGDNNKTVSNVLGISGGFQDLILKVDLKLSQSREKVDSTKYHYRSFGGVFWKLLFGERKNLDVTQRLLFGTRHNYNYVYAPHNIPKQYDVSQEKKFNMVYSLSMGFLIPRSRTERNVTEVRDITPPQTRQEPEMLTISVESNQTDAAMGEIKPDGEVRVERGADQTFTIAANLGFMLDTLVVDGKSVGAPNEYTVQNIQQNVKMAAFFSEVTQANIAEEATVHEGINFETGTADLTDCSRRELESIYLTLVKNPEMKIEIAGHTDITGSRAFNVRLSEDRAKSVVNYLVARGIAADRLSSKGYGCDYPIADNETPEGRAKNRRVEIRSINEEEN